MKSRYVFLLLAAGMCLTAGCGAKKKEVPITTASEQAREFYIQGREKFESVQRTEAIELMKKAIEKDPEFAMANLALYNLGVENGRAHLEKAVQAVDKVSEGEKLNILINKAGRDGDNVKIEELTRKLVELYPGDKRAHLQMALLQFNRQQYQDAIAEFQKAIALDKKYAIAYNMMGYSHLYLGNFAEAEKSLRMYLDRVPTDPNSHDSYAEVLMKQGRFQKSIEEYRKALSLKPDFYNSYGGWAMNLCLMGKFEEAREKVRELAARTSDPYEQYNIHFLHGMINLYDNKPDQARKDFSQLIPVLQQLQYDASVPVVYFLLSRIDVSRNRLAEAEENYRKARDFIRESGNLSDQAREGALSIVLVGEVELAVAKGDAKEAKARTEQFRKYAETTRNPIDMQSWHGLAGLVALLEKRYDDAIAELDQTSKRWASNYFYKGLAYARKGDKEKARESFETVIHFNDTGFDTGFFRHQAMAELEKLAMK